METNLSPDPIATPTDDPGPARPVPARRRIWVLLGVLVAMSAAAVASNIVFYQPPIRTGFIGLKPGDPGPRDIGAMLGKVPKKKGEEGKGRGQRKDGLERLGVEDGYRKRAPVEVDDPADAPKDAPKPADPKPADPKPAVEPPAGPKA